MRKTIFPCDIRVAVPAVNTAGFDEMYLTSVRVASRDEYDAQRHLEEAVRRAMDEGYKNLGQPLEESPQTLEALMKAVTFLAGGPATGKLQLQLITHQGLSSLASDHDGAINKLAEVTSIDFDIEGVNPDREPLHDVDGGLARVSHLVVGNNTVDLPSLDEDDLDHDDSPEP